VVTDQIEGIFVDYVFINSQVGWRYSMSELQRTDDGGLSWKRVALPIDRDHGEIGAMRFLPDGERGWVVGGLYYPLPPGPEGEGISRGYQNLGKVPRGTIYYTTDGGRTWARQYLAKDLDTLISVLYVPSDGQAWALGHRRRVYHFQGRRWGEVNFNEGSCD